MLLHPQQKYRAFESIELTDRTWPDHKIRHAPRWCSTDLRDGNQSLVNPMSPERKLKFFRMLLECGFKEIEVAFPSASETDFLFVRQLIEHDLIPDDVQIQVLTQARRDLIERTFESLRGAKQATIHLYNATAEVFRRIVFKMSEQEVTALAVSATQYIRELCDQHPETQWTFEYSPETFCFTEARFALEICEAVSAAWAPSENRPMILNLPTTVEVSMPNIFADQVEWFCRNFSQRKNVCISIHPHNDRGTGVATAEMALLAGADRIEGCLFGNGERTGNVDLVTLALNLYTQGISPQLDFSHIQQVVEVVTECNELPVHPRHPYAGELVFTAFSGSHQDAIKKGFAARKNQQHSYWEIPYLPIDPEDLGCNYEAVIRVNSQSGKSGAAWILQQNHGIDLPPKLQREFSQIIQQRSDQDGKELGQAQIWEIFCEHYALKQEKLRLSSYNSFQPEQGLTEITLSLNGQNVTCTLQGCGNGLLSASCNALSELIPQQIQVLDYQEHTLGKATSSRSICYLQVQLKGIGIFWGIAIDHDIGKASIQALLNACAQAETVTHIPEAL